MDRLVPALATLMDPVSLMGRIAEQVCALMPKADGAAIALLRASDNAFVTVSGYGVMAGTEGFSVPNQSSFQGLAARQKRPQLIDDAIVDLRLSPRVRAMNRSWGTRSWAVVPLLHGDEPIGSLMLVARAPAAFDAADVALMLEVSQFVSALTYGMADGDELGKRTITARFVASVMIPEAVEAHELQDQLDALLMQPDGLSAVFQPIVHLPSGKTVGYEGLTRFPSSSEFTPLQWFSAARRVGRGLDLEFAALSTILTAARRIPAEVPVAVNLSPKAAGEETIQDVLTTAGRALGVEITEHEPFPDDLALSLTRLREQGMTIAIDDAGAGYASFTQILRLQPDAIKIDGELITGIDTDPAKRALTTAMNTLATELNAATVAEAVETPQQLQTLIGLGIEYGQGFHLGRPQ
ncbi:sensor domain-containing phosphodiesterase [Mycolicibacterium anyangense]|uniref:sensor domain-containing phosphodiesterase n=1 Tax=Mycolicibacterium anyangense TaxID=1431246 RepID=UPI0013D2D861|nr:EAL domain-containing protein [Mycolicibacterium anyangense]